MDDIIDLDSVALLEQTFYKTGYDEGFAHGRIHGLIEGRSSGRAKGFEMWEELGFYEGFAMMWREIYIKQSKTDDRAAGHIRHLLELISKFPRINPSASDAASEMDIPKLFRQIRSRYKALCSTLGVRPSLRYSEKSEERGESADPAAVPGMITKTRRDAGSIWKLEKPPKEDSLEF